MLTIKKYLYICETLKLKTMKTYRFIYFDKLNNVIKEEKHENYNIKAARLFAANKFLNTSDNLIFKVIVKRA